MGLKKCFIFILFFVIGSFAIAQQTYQISNFESNFLPIGYDGTKAFLIYEFVEEEKYDFVEFTVFNNNLQKLSSGRVKVDLGTEIVQFESNDTHFCFALKNRIKENFKILVFNLEGQNIGKKTYSKRRNKDIGQQIEQDAITPKVAASKTGFFLIKYDKDYKKGYEVRKVNNQLQSIWKSFNYHKGEGLQAFLKLEEVGDDILIYNALIHKTTDLNYRFEIDIIDNESGDYINDIYFAYNHFTMVPNSMITEKNGDKVFAGVYYEGGRINDKIADGVFLAKIKKDKREWKNVEDKKGRDRTLQYDRSGRKSDFKFVEFVNYDDKLRQTAYNIKGDNYKVKNKVRYHVPTIYKSGKKYKTVVEMYKLEDETFNLAIQSDNQLVAYFQTLKQRNKAKNAEYEIDEDDWLNLSDKRKKEDTDKQKKIEEEFKKTEKEERKKEKAAEKVKLIEEEKKKAENEEKDDIRATNKKIKEYLKKGGDVGKKNNEAQQQTKKKLKLKDNTKEKVKEKEIEILKKEKKKRRKTKIDTLTFEKIELAENEEVQDNKKVKNKRERTVEISRIEEYKRADLENDLVKGFVKDVDLLDFYSLTFTTDSGKLINKNFIKKQHKQIEVEQQILGIGNLAFLNQTPSFLAYKTSSNFYDANQYFVYEEIIDDKNVIYKLADLNGKNPITSQLIKNRLPKFAQNKRSNVSPINNNRLLFYTFDAETDKYIFWTENMVAQRKIDGMLKRVELLKREEIKEKVVEVETKKEFDELEEMDDEQLKRELRILELKEQLRERTDGNFEK